MTQRGPVYKAVRHSTAHTLLSHRWKHPIITKDAFWKFSKTCPNNIRFMFPCSWPTFSYQYSQKILHHRALAACMHVHENEQWHRERTFYAGLGFYITDWLNMTSGKQISTQSAGTSGTSFVRMFMFFRYNFWTKWDIKKPRPLSVGTFSLPTTFVKSTF